ncbi:MAG TPA: response regulator [Bryobacteraceae bacterium]|nr:response regulator [Bryobacteraceae bacterium]
MAASGSNPSRAPDRSSTSPSPGENRQARPYRILVVEDNAADLFLIQDAIRGAGITGEVHVARDGRKAVEFLDGVHTGASAACPDLLLLDLNLPLRNGVEVLKHLRGTHRCRHIPVIIVTSSNSEPDREAARALGATRYFRKPSNYEEFMKLGSIVRGLLADATEEPPREQ